MRKPFHFTKLSNLECCEPGCRRRIKANVLARKEPENARRCYKHYRQRAKEGQRRSEVARGF